jgi:hypothetical protein
MALKGACAQADSDLAIGPRMFSRCPGEWIQALKIERTTPSTPVPQAMFSAARQQGAAR